MMLLSSKLYYFMKVSPINICYSENIEAKTKVIINLKKKLKNGNKNCNVIENSCFIRKIRHFSYEFKIQDNIKGNI